jgi:hypothetical protein
MRLIYFFFFISITSINAQNFVLTDSVFTVYPARISPSDTILTVKTVNQSELPFELTTDFYAEKLPYSLILIAEIQSFGFYYYQIEFGKGKGLKHRISYLYNQNGQYLKQVEHEVETTF